MSRRPKSLYDARKRFNAKSIDSIDAHEEQITSVIKNSSRRSDQISLRLEKFQCAFHKDEKQDCRIQWIRQQNKLNYDVDAMTKSLKDVTKSILQRIKKSNSQYTIDLIQDFTEEYASQVGSDIHRIKGFVLEACRKRFNIERHNRDYRNCKAYNDLNQEMTTEYQNVDIARQKLEDEIKMCKESWINHRSMEDFRIQTLKRKIIEMKRNLHSTCKYCKCNGLIANDEYYYDLSNNIEVELESIERDLMDATKNKRKNEPEISSRKTLEEKVSNLQHKSLVSYIKNCHRQKQLLMGSNTKCDQNTTIERLDSLREQIIGQIWHQVCVLLKSIEEDERALRICIVSCLKKCTSETDSDAIDRKRRKDAEREKEQQCLRDKDRLDSKMKLEQYYFMQEIEEIERKNIEQERLRVEDEQKKERGAQNIER